jgi:hypothetical protein
MEEKSKQETDAKVQRLQHSLEEMESTLTDHYCTVGKQILEVAEREDREISDLVDQIIETKKKLSQLQKGEKV